MELDELEVGELGAGGAREQQARAVGAGRVRGARPQRRGAARREDHRARRRSCGRRRTRRRGRARRRRSAARGRGRPSSTSIRSSSTTSAESWRRIRRPVALPPAWTTRRMPWPPSSPSARLPWRSASKRTPSASRSANRAGASARQDLGGGAAHEPAAGRDRVLQVQRGGVVDRERRGQPALRPVGRGLGQRARGDERDAGAGAGGGERREEPGGPGADHDEIARRLLHGAVRYRGCRRWFRHDAGLAHEVPGHPERPARIVALEAEMERHDWFGWERVEAPRATREQLSRVHSPRARRPDRRAVGARRRRDRHGHDARSPAPTRRRCAARAAPSRSSTRCSATASRAASRRCARPGTTPRRRARWASASSTTSRSAAAHARGGARRGAGADPRLGRPPRQRDERHLPRRPVGAVLLDPRVAAVSGHRPGVRRWAPAPGEGFTVNLPVPGGSGDAVHGSLVEHVVAPLIRGWEPELVLDLGRLRRAPGRPARHAAADRGAASPR